MNIKKTFFILLIITMIILSAATVTASAAAPVVPLGNWGLGDSFSIRYGTNDFLAYTYEFVQDRYIDNSQEPQVTDLYLENNYLQYQQYGLQLDDINAAVSDYKQLAEQANELAETYRQEADTSTGAAKEEAVKKMQECLINAESYKESMADSISQKAELYVQKENCYFIYNNSSDYRKIKQASQTAGYRESIYNLELLDKKYYAQGTLAEYARLQADAENINKSKELSFQSDVDFYNADFDYYTNQQDMIKQQYNAAFELLLNTADLSLAKGTSITADVRKLRVISLKSYSSVESSSFLYDFKGRQLQDKVRILDGKISILKEYYLDSSNLVKIAQNEKKLATLEMNQWILQRRAILQKYYSDYKGKYYELAANEKKTKALYEKYVILLNKYNYNLVSRLSLKEAEVNYIQSSLTAWNSMYEYVIALGKIEKAMCGGIE
jgi:hypothetical protein